MDLNQLSSICHKANIKWWLDLNSPCCQNTNCVNCDGQGYLVKTRNFGELIALCHSELSEALEGHRKNLMDDKLPHRHMVEVELADLLIRVFDLAGGYNLDLQGAFDEKMNYNASREDHKVCNRLTLNGKKY